MDILFPEIKRSELVEIGAFSSQGANQGTFLARISPIFIVLALKLPHCLITATREVERVLRRAKIELKEICEADPKVLTSEERVQWGRYYEHKPKVYLIDGKRSLINNLDYLLGKVSVTVKDVYLGF